MSQLVVLFESAVGYFTFKVVECEDIGSLLPEIQKSIGDGSKFKKIVKLTSSRTFDSAAESLNNANAVSEGIMTDFLKAFLEEALPTPRKHITLGVLDPKLGSSIREEIPIKIECTGAIPELIRGIRMHMSSVVKKIPETTVRQAELGLGHSYSRCKVKYNVNKSDTMITQSIALIDLFDKDINLYAMRIREWYSYHFPELAKVITDNRMYAACVEAIEDRKTINESTVDKLNQITLSEELSLKVLEEAKMSMGMDISPMDLITIRRFSKSVKTLATYKTKLAEYMKGKMTTVAPNLTCVIGENVGARLISQAGSVVKLAKAPASTLQILGAEKALFRAIKKKAATPKYGLIYHSSHIGQASAKNKGRISRFLANKCSLATRIDCFSDLTCDVFGQKLRKQIEDRNQFYESGDVPPRNEEIMGEAAQEYSFMLEQSLCEESMEEAKTSKKRKFSQLDSSLNETKDPNETSSPPKKKKKKKNRDEESTTELDDSQNLNLVLESSEKKKKKKNKKSEDEDLDETQESIPDNSEKKKKKKKKKDLETTIDDTTELDETQEETSVKKKKKNKKSLNGSINNGTTEDEDMEASFMGSETPKKKKKKNKDKKEAV